MPFYYSPYLILPLLSVVVNAGLAGYSLRHRQIPAARPLFWLMLGMSGWSWAYALNTAATSLALKIFCFKLGLSFVCLIPPAILALALESIGRGDWLTRRRLLLICGLPFLSLLLVWTNEFHYLVRSNLHLYQSGPLLLLGFKDGLYHQIHILYVVLANFIAIVLLASAFWHYPRREWPRFALLIIATMLPLAVEILQITPVKGFVMTTSCLFMSGVLYAWAIFRHQLLDVVPLARATLFAQIGEPVLVFDNRGELVDCNQSARLLAGDGLKQGLIDVYRSILIRLPQLNDRLRCGANIPFETSLDDTVEAGRCWRISSSPVQSAGTLRGRLVLLHDISDLKQVERKLTESDKQLRELNSSLQVRVEEETKRRLAQERMLANHSRLAAMGEMIGAIAHQWRQPLATLGMIVQRTHAVGTMQGLTPEYLDEFKANAMRQVRYMSDTIEEFRGFYRLEKQKEPFSPYNCIADALRLFEPQFTSSGIRVEITCQAGADRLVSGFPNEFKQVVLNLLGNARDAILDSRNAEGTPESGRIGVEIAIREPSLMHIDVSDNGCGIPAEIAPRIFDPYFTTKEESGGTGIGLYMSRMIVEDSLDGHLSLLENRNGALFRIELPLEKQS
jgi:signal transduction histidine kinase